KRPLTPPAEWRAARRGGGIWWSLLILLAVEVQTCLGQQITGRLEVPAGLLQVRADASGQSPVVVVGKASGFDAAGGGPQFGGATPQVGVGDGGEGHDGVLSPVRGAGGRGGSRGNAGGESGRAGTSAVRARCRSRSASRR